MNHLGTQQLETDRLILRRFSLADADAMFRNWANDPCVTKYLTWKPHGDISVSKAILAEWVESYEKPNTYLWAVVPKSIGEAIGGISVVHGRDETKMVHIGYCIGQTWWGRGYTSEAFAEIIRFFFEKVGVNRIESRHDPNNPKSGKVMIKCGLRCEGTLRQSDVNNQGLCDAAHYAILADDWLKMFS